MTGYELRRIPLTKLCAEDETQYGWQVWALNEVPEPVTPALLSLGTLAEFLARYDVRGGLRQTPDQAFIKWLNGEAAALKANPTGENK